MSIDPSAYSSESVFDVEIERLFYERMYVGTTADFQGTDSYKSFRIGRKAVSVRCTSESIKAFGNVCLHRNALIDPTGSGQREFRCGYHGWAYAADGRLRSTPLTEKDSIRRCALPVYPVVQCAGLVFVGLNGAAPEVSRVKHALDRINVPDKVTPAFHADSLAHECNWKLLVENVLEGYHLSFVHTGTFLPAGFTSTSRYKWDCDEYVCWNTLTPTVAPRKLDALKRLAPGATHAYRHTYVFPDLFVSSTDDLVGFRSHVIPIGPCKSVLEWELFELPALQALAPSVRQHIANEAIQFTTTALKEDKVLVESSQIGLQCDDAGMQLQPQEARVQRFHDYYAERMQHA